MKKGIRFFAAAVFSTALVWSCSQDGSGPESGNVPENVKAAFDEMYPSAANVTWSAKDVYWVASFESATKSASDGRNSAWYDNGGKWYMTEFNSERGLLPEAVLSAFQSSEYASWHIDDVDVIERYGVETVYVIEVEGNKDGVRMEVDLYYSEEGVLIKEVVDADDDYDYGDFIPSEPASGISDFIAQKYPSARIVDIDVEDGMTEVEIVDGSYVREVYFDRNGAWTATKTEVRYNDVPEPVRSAVATGYPSYRVDDIDHYLMADSKEFYRFELESRDGDLKVDVTLDGTITEAAPGNPGHDGENPGLDPAVSDFIATRYPGAEVKEKDYDHGYLQVEIFHDGKEKELYFNGGLDWVWTEWDVRYNELPEEVKDVLSGEYASWEKDDISFVETADSSYYSIEMEDDATDREMVIRINEKGEVLSL